jgi:nucleotide-binding universal stress UspA family protein
MRRSILFTFLVGAVGFTACSAAPGTEDETVNSAPLTGSGGARHVCSAPTPGGVACTSLVRTDAQGLVTPLTTPSGYGPADLQSAYDIPAIQTGVTVAIVDLFDNPNAESDLATYRSTFGLPACTSASGCFRKVNENGAASPLPAANSGWATEISLDIQMVSAACPSCKILLVEAKPDTNADIDAAEDTAAKLGAIAISNSFGAPESSGQTSDDSHFNHPGVGIFASTGDSGFSTAWPAASRYVTAVGGTTLTRAPSTARGWTETVWSGAGAGCSSVESKPSWQRDTGCAKRTIGDVSAVADLATGVALYDSYGSGGWVVAGGTSVASPLNAAIHAVTQVAGVALAFSYYGGANSFNDVTSGNDGTCSPAYLCTGEVGYDGPTGNGTPDAQSMMTANGRSFQALDSSDVFVLGTDHKLWLEHAPFGSVPPSRQEVDAAVLTFQAEDSSDVFVLGTDHKLWLEHAPFGSVPPSRQEVDAGVLAFQALDNSDVLVLGNDRKLWLEHAPFGSVPPSRQEVDAGVLSFQAIDGSHVLVLGSDHKLWLEHAPFGSVPPSRQEVDAAVLAFQALDSSDILVLGSDRKLWLESGPFGSVPPARKQVDGGVLAFQALDSQTAYVLGLDGKLWLESAPFGSVPPARKQVDAGVVTFRALDSQTALVLGRDLKLWLEHGPFGAVPPTRQQVDGAVMP